MSQKFTSSTLPQDHKAHIRLMKQQLRTEIGDVDALFIEVKKRIQQAIATAKAEEAQNGTAWPVVTWQDIADQNISSQQIEAIKRRGCVVVRQNFDREQALNWDRSMMDYLDRNDFDRQYRGPGDAFFGLLDASRPEIYPVYWSKAQMEARQSDRMAITQSFLNRLWKFEVEGKRCFDPDVSIIYPDRIRRRPPGTTSTGLGAHTDSGALERWLLPEYQRVYQSVFSGHPADYDPWDATHRPDIHEYDVADTTKCSAFRTFQGWTALSDMALGQGLLHVLPVPDAIAYILLRPLLKDVPEEELCGVAPGKVLPISSQWHPELIAGLCSIPSLQAGDSVWWHCDVVHSVAPVDNQQGWGNVMYIPAAPLCPKNLTYAHHVRQALQEGLSPADFPRENYEQTWEDRFLIADLNPIGRAGLGLAPE